jgi:hypothetical protein
MNTVGGDLALIFRAKNIWPEGSQLHKIFAGCRLTRRGLAVSTSTNTIP